MKKNIALLPGDGIGPEIVDSAVRVLECIAKIYGHEFCINYGLIGAAAIKVTGDPYPELTHELCSASDAILFGAVGDPAYDNNPAAKVRPEQGLLKMRSKLNLFCNIRPVKSYDSLLGNSPLKESIIKGVDLVVVRELTGGIYFGEPRGRSESGDMAYDSCVYSKDEIMRVSRIAFEYAKSRRGKVTMVDKANVLATSRLWRECVAELRDAEYRDIELDYMFVDNAAMQLVLNPGRFDVILTENMFGDILSDVAAVIPGSIGLLPSASVGNRISLYEPIHGSYPQAAGKGIANPIATILSLAMMLEHSFGLITESKAIVSSCELVIKRGELTPDIVTDNSFSTEDVTSLIIKEIESM